MSHAEITRRTIKLITDDLDPAVRDRLRAQCKGKTLGEQLDIVTAEAMKGWKQPAWMTRPVADIDPVELKDRSARAIDGKAAAAGERE